MKLKNVRKILSSYTTYMVGINGDYIGNFTRKQLKQYDELEIITIWTIKDRSGCICLDLIDKRRF